MSGFLDERLGKGVVVAKDRPNFIANRIGTYGALVTMRTMIDDGYSIEEVDKITGPAAGRPKTATFRTFDLVGLDVFAHVIKNLHENLPDDPEREMFVMPEFVTKMIERGLLGNKTKAGFYQRKQGEGGKREIWTIDTATLDYRPAQKVKLPSLDVAKNIEDTRERLKTVVWCKGSRRRVSLEDDLKNSDVHSRTHSRDSRHRRRSRSRDALGLQLGAWAVRGLGRDRRRKVSREAEGRRPRRSGECAGDARFRREVFLQTGKRPAASISILPLRNTCRSRIRPARSFSSRSRIAPESSRRTPALR